MKTIAAYVVCVLAASAFADEPAKPEKAVKLADVAWLAGNWKAPEGERIAGEEIWSAPAGGGMMGMFRFLTGDKVGLYEFMLIEQDAEGVSLRFRHYRPTMIDADKAPMKLRVTEATRKKIVFTNPDAAARPKRITYERDEGDNMTVTIETERGGKPVTIPVKLKRATNK